jgi:hypothetical protein
MQLSPEINAILDDLTRLCCDALQPGGMLDHDRVRSLAANLSTNGWERHTTKFPPLSDLLKDRIKKSCLEPAMHRGAMIDGIVGEVQKLYADASRYQASAPKTKRPPSMLPRSTGT